MKKLIIVLVIALAGISCSRNKMPQKTAAELNAEPVRAEKAEQPEEKEILEIEERLIDVDEEPPADYRYFVIIGSFRSKDNAMQYQSDIGEKGFSSVLLRNEEGFYRVSVMATDDIETARGEIRRIRTGYPEHEDTWLLIRRR